ncbi:MAG: beta strand repeat-containing protein [Alphaproteobacteria bacterium]
MSRNAQTFGVAMSKLHKNLVSGLSGLLLGTTALTGVAVAQVDVTSNATVPSVVFGVAPVVNQQLSAAQGHAAPVTGSIVGTDVSVIAAGPIAADVIISSTVYGAAGTANSATETILASAAGDRRSVGVAQDNSGAVVSETLSSLTGLDLQHIASGPMVVEVDNTTYTVASQANVSTAFNAGGALVTGSALDDATTTVGAGTATALGEIAIATAQTNSGEVTSDLNDGNTATRNLIGVEMSSGTASITNTGGVIVSNTTATAMATANSATSTVVDAVTVGDVDVAVATFQSISSGADITADARENHIGIEGVGGASITGAAPGAIPLTISDNHMGSEATGNSATHTITARPDAAGDQVVGAILQDFQAGSEVDVRTRSNTFGVSTRDTNLTGATITISGNRGTATAIGNEAAQDVLVDVGGVGGAGITTTTTQTAAEEDVEGRVDDALIGVEVRPDGGGFGGTLSGATVLIEGNEMLGTGLVNTARQSLGAVTGDITAPIAQTINQTVGPGSTGGAEADAVSNNFGVSRATGINNTSIQISNNRNVATTIYNNAESLRGDLTGTITASVTQDVIQRNEDLGSGAESEARAAYFGVNFDTDAALAQADGDVNLLVANNISLAHATNNMAVARSGAIAGVVSGTINVSVSATQTNFDTDVESDTSSSEIGITRGFNTTPLGTDTYHTDLTVAGNELRALSQGNAAALAAGDVTGTLSAGANYGVTSTQLNRRAIDGTGDGGEIRAQAGESRIGWRRQTVAHGIDDQDFTILVQNNVSAVTAIGNMAAHEVGQITGTVDGSTVTARATQTNEDGDDDGEIVADGGNPIIGIISDNGAFVLGTMSNNVATFAVTGNRSEVDGIGNTASVAIGDVTGTVSDNSSVRAEIDQTNSGLDLTSDAGSIDMGVQAGGGTDSAGSDGTVVIDVTNNISEATTTGNAALAQLGDMTGTIDDSDYLINTTQTSQQFDSTDSTFRARAEEGRIGYFASAVMGRSGSVRTTISGNAVSATTQVNDATNVLAGASGTIDGSSIVGAGNIQTVSSAIASATATDNAIGAVELTGDIADEGDVALTVSGNSVGAATSLNTSTQLVAGAVGTVGSDSVFGMGTTQNATPAGGATVSATTTVSDAQIGVSADGTATDIANEQDATASLNVTGNSLGAAATGNAATQTLNAVTGTVDGLSVILSEQGLDAGVIVSSGLGTLAPVGIGVLGVDDISDTTRATANIAIAGNTATSTASGNGLVQNIMPGGLTGTLAGAFISDPIQFIDGADIDAVTSGAQIGLSHDGSGADTSDSSDAVTNVAVSANWIGAAATGNRANLNLGDVTGTASGDITLIPLQTNSGNTDIDAALNITGIGVERVGHVGNGANSITTMTVAGNVQTASLIANDATINTGDLVGALSNTVTLTTDQANTLGTSQYSATILNSDTGIRIIGDVADSTGSSFTPIVANNNTVASLVGNRSGVRLRALAVSGGGATVNVGATQLNVGTGSPNPSLLASLDDSIETGVHLPGEARDGINAIVSGNNASADLIGNAAVTQFDDVGGVLTGSINVADNQTNTDIFGTASAADVFTQIDANSGATLAVSSVLNDNRIGTSITGNLQVAQINTSGLSVGGVIGISGTQSNTGGAFRATVTGSIIGVAASAATSITGTSIVRGSTIGATAIGNSATSSIR